MGVRPDTSSKVRRLGLSEAAERAPVVTWGRLRGYLATEWEQGQHVSIFGPNGSGKTTAMLGLCGHPGHRPVVLVATKHRDDLIRRQRQQGWKICQTLEQVERACDGTLVDRWLRWKEPEQIEQDAQVVFWPATAESIKQRRVELGEQVGALLDYAYARGDITVALDEALYVSDDLRLKPNLNACLHEGRASALSLLVASQRPSWLPRSAYSAPTYLLMFSTNDPDDLKRLGDIGGGLDAKMLRRELQLLDKHEFLFVAPRDRPPWVVRCKIPPRRKKPKP